MPLRAKKPEHIEKRLKLFLYGEAGVGKTLAAAQFPLNYIIDTEHGSDNYGDVIKKANSVVFHTTDINETIEEVRALRSEAHEFRTVTIDPSTNLFVDALDKGERLVGSDFGRHYGFAGKLFGVLVNGLTDVDMNVIVTSHAKTEYGDDMKKVGITFDSWKKLDYVFDLVIRLEKQGKRRMAFVKKTRIEEFPDGDVFEWSYEELAKRCGTTIAAKAVTSPLANAEQVAEIEKLIKVVALREGTVDKWFKKAHVESWADMTSDAIQKCIDYVKKELAKAAA